MTVSSLRQRLTIAWQALRGDGPAAVSAPVAADGGLAAESVGAALRLQLQEAQQQATTLRRDLDAERAGRAAAVDTALQVRLQPVLADTATLMGQLALQSRLLDEGKSLAARDVMALAQALCRACERLGLSPLAAAGDTAAFDPDQHQSLAGSPLTAGQPVQVKIPGYRCGRQVLRKSFVEAVSKT
jgi:molecular chaperone GrpE (heat shock protein)